VVGAAPPAPRPVTYVGLVTRALAFAIDAGIINLVAVVTAGLVDLVLSIVTIHHGTRNVLIAIAGAVYVLWVAGYFVVFWATTGQTPGDRLLHIRVRPASGDRILPRRALLRFLALLASALPLFAGFLPILFDDRRRGVHDMVARTVVIDDDEPR
jgi:uncharacterized RDD family membrane protein YckC